MRKWVTYAVVGALVVAGCGVLHRGSSRAARYGMASRSVSARRFAARTVPAATMSQLLSGRWSALPRAPIAPHYGATVVWSGQQLIVWGGSASSTQQPLATGAAYVPSRRRWRLLPPAPLSGRDGNAAVWTGQEMLVWGGYTSASPHRQRVARNGAAYNPTSDTWRVLPPAPLTARAFPLAVWTGHQMLLLGGQPAVQSSPMRSYRDGAAYDPSINRWTHIAAPAPPRGHGIDWIAAVQAGNQLLAWSNWSITRELGRGSFSERGGVDLFAYNEHAGRWRLLPTKPTELPSVSTALWTEHDVLVRGITYNCGACPGPFVPEATDLFNPARNTWSRLPPDPLGSNDPLSAWSGAALISFNAGGTFGPIIPGDATAYDPATKRWRTLPRAPFGCDSSQPPIWTGTQLLMYCPRPTNGNASQYDGLAFTIHRKP